MNDLSQMLTAFLIITALVGGWFVARLLVIHQQKKEERRINKSRDLFMLLNPTFVGELKGKTFQEQYLALIDYYGDTETGVKNAGEALWYYLNEYRLDETTGRTDQWVERSTKTVIPFIKLNTDSSGPQESDPVESPIIKPQNGAGE